MRNIKLLTPILLLFVFSNCKKDTSPENPTPPESFQTMSYTAQNNPDSVQAITTKSTGEVMTFYGSFNAVGIPSIIKTCVYKSSASSDTSFNFILDDSSRVKVAFASYAGGNLPEVYIYDYSDVGIAWSIYDYNWTLGTGVLKKSASFVKNGNNYVMTSAGTFKQTISSDIFDIKYTSKVGEVGDAEWQAQIANLQAALIVTNTIAIVASGAIGFLICGPVCGVLAAVVAYDIIAGNQASASTTITHSLTPPPITVPTNPFPIAYDFHLTGTGVTLLNPSVETYNISGSPVTGVFCDVRIGLTEIYPILDLEQVRWEGGPSSANPIFKY
jgi:hypothetical protein